MFALAVTAAGFAWWWNRERGRAALDFYGPAAVQLIRTASKVELSRDGEAVRDISKAQGLLNARTSLLSDASYQSMGSGQLPSADFTVRFTEGDESVGICFDADQQRIQIVGTDKVAELSRKTANGWRNYLERQMGAMQVTPLGPKHKAPLE